jgi:hypothetical protein
MTFTISLDQNLVGAFSYAFTCSWMWKHPAKKSGRAEPSPTKVVTHARGRNSNFVKSIEKTKATGLRLSISEIASGLKWATELIVDGALEAVNTTDERQLPMYQFDRSLREPQF